MAKILYLADNSFGSTSSHRANALRRIGHDVEVRDAYVLANSYGSLVSAVHFQTGYFLLQSALERWLKNVIRNLEQRPDLIWVDMGELFGPNCLKLLKTLNAPIILYNVDDPTGKRDGRRFNALLKSIQYYDLIAVVRQETANECTQLGAKRVVRVFRSYDEVEHRPFAAVNEIPKALRSEVAFIGTWMRHERRDEFLMKLIEQGVPVSIWGNRWQKSAYFGKLESNWKGPALYGRDYVGAIQGSRICLGMLSKGNRDLHTQRSLEVPFAGGLFCAERTAEHQYLYTEGKEAVFWSDVKECADVCNRLLGDEPLRESIRLAGAVKVRALNLGNEDVCSHVLSNL
jgi:hypothetical protein